MGLAVGHVPVATIIVEGRGVDAAVAGPALVEKFEVGVAWVDEAAAAASSLSPGSSSVKPALVAVAAGGVTGQSVTAGVTGVLSLTLHGGHRGHKGHREKESDRQLEVKERRRDERRRPESDLRVSVWRVFPRDFLSGYSPLARDPARPPRRLCWDMPKGLWTKHTDALGIKANNTEPPCLAKRIKYL